jgi:hypothetical protein
MFQHRVDIISGPFNGDFMKTDAEKSKLLYKVT